MADRTVTITLRVVDEFSAALGKFNASLGQTQAAHGAATKATVGTTQAAIAYTGRTADATQASLALGTQLTQLGRGMMSTFTGFIAGVAAAAGLKQAISGTIGAFIGFDQAMRQVNTVALLNEAQFRALSDEVKEFTRTNRNFLGSAKDAANALNIVVQAGIKVEDGLTFLKAAAVGATAGFTDIKQVTQALVGIMNAYSESANRAMHNTNVLAQTVAVGVITWQQLTQFIGEVAQTAAATKQPIEVVGAAIATMTQKGIQADMAVTALNRTLLSILTPSAEARKLAAERGIEWNLEALQAKGLVTVLSEMMAATGGNAQMIDVLTGDVRAFRGILALTNDGGIAFNRTLVEMQQAQQGVGVASKQANEALKATSAGWAEFKKQVSLAATALGEPLSVLGLALAQLPLGLIKFLRAGVSAPAGGAIGVPVELQAKITKVSLPTLGEIQAKLDEQKIAAARLNIPVYIYAAIEKKLPYAVTGIPEEFRDVILQARQAEALYGRAIPPEPKLDIFGKPRQPGRDILGRPVPISPLQFFRPEIRVAEEASKAIARAVVPEFGLAGEFLTKGYEENINRLNEQLDNLRASSNGAGDATRGLRRALREQQDVLRENAEQVQRLERRLSDLRRTLDDLARPRLIGAGVFEEQVFQLEQQIDQARLAELQGGGDEGRRRELERQLEILRLQRKIFVAPIERQAAVMAKPPGPEMAPEEVFQNIRDVQQAILETEVALAASKASYELNKDAVDNLSRQMDAASESASGVSETMQAQKDMINAQMDLERKAIDLINETLTNEKLYAEFLAKKPEEQEKVYASFKAGLDKLRDKLNLSADEVREAMLRWMAIFEPGLWQHGTMSAEAEMERQRGFQHGGIIPGPPGAPRLIRAEAGELILNQAQQRALVGTGAGVTVNFNSTFPPRKEDAENIVDAIEERLQERHRRTPGGLLQ